MKRIIYAILGFQLLACQDGPVELQPENQSSSNTENVLEQSSIFGNKSPKKGNTQNADFSDVHRVKVLEVLEAQKYVYLKVEEEGRDYWLATLKMEVEAGAYYYFTGGLAKENFESKEYNRVWDQMLLVQNIVPENHGGNGQASHASNEHNHNHQVAAKSATEGFTSLAEIVENPEKFKGKVVRIEAKITKINENIMGLNWVHLDDGTLADYDFVATTNEDFAALKEVKIEGTVALNKDFGAGYFYEIILENGKQIP